MKAARPVDAGTLASRLRARLAELGVSLSRVAEAVGVSKPLAGQWTSGKAKPIPADVETLATWLGLEPHWLATGEGPRAYVGALTLTDLRLVEARRRLAALTAETKVARAELRRLEAEQADAQERAYARRAEL